MFTVSITVLMLQGTFWREIDPNNSKTDVSFKYPSIRVAKSSKCLGSWPYIFQSLAIASESDNQPKIIWQKNKASFEYRCKTTYKKRKQHLLDLKAAFIQDVREQLGPGLVTTKEQPTVCFPSDVVTCLEYLASCQHVPAAQKLLKYSTKVYTHHLSSNRFISIVCIHSGSDRVGINNIAVLRTGYTTSQRI